MSAYMVRRFIGMLWTVWAVVTIVFFMMQMIPGDPVTTLLGEFSTPQEIARVREVLGLNKPLYEQYYDYVVGLLHGDMGRSLRTKEAVSEQLARAFPNSLQLMIAATMWSMPVGIVLGIIAAVFRGRPIDKLLTAVATMFVSLPGFFIALSLLYIVGFRLGLLPIGGAGGPMWTWDGFSHLILPAISLGFSLVAVLTRITRSAILDILGTEYIRTARAKGLDERTVLYRHALRNAMLPILTSVGLSVARLLGGAVVSETVYGFPGMGRLVVTSISYRDFVLAQGVLLVIAVTVVVVNWTVDLLYGFVDPRIRYS